MKTNENFQLSTFNFQPDKRLAVVILNWNGRALMEEFLPSVVACTPGEWADVIVADNGSTDDSIEMLKTKFPTVGIIRLDKNYGFAEGYNQALGHGSLPVRPYGHLQRGGRPRCRVLCPPGRNRSVLAATFARLPAGLYAIVGRVPRGRRHAECRESAQDVPQLPKQPADAI